MNYKEARALVVSPLYKGIKEPGGVRHPRDLKLPEPVGNWGTEYSMALFYEKQLNSYIARYFGVYPEIGWTMDLMANRGRE
jgi:hypothetical protein